MTHDVWMALLTAALGGATAGAGWILSSVKKSHDRVQDKERAEWEDWRGNVDRQLRQADRNFVRIAEHFQVSMETANGSGHMRGDD